MVSVALSAAFSMAAWVCLPASWAASKSQSEAEEKYSEPQTRKLQSLIETVRIFVISLAQTWVYAYIFVHIKIVNLGLTFNSYNFLRI